MDDELKAAQELTVEDLLRKMRNGEPADLLAEGYREQAIEALDWAEASSTAVAEALMAGDIEPLLAYLRLPPGENESDA